VLFVVHPEMTMILRGVDPQRNRISAV